MKTATVLVVTVAGLLGAAVASAAPRRYIPGVGEIMAATQMRHAKLWYAGSAGNWDLAAYEIDELKEGFDDAATYHPTFKHGARIADILPRFVTTPLDELAKAVKAKDRERFVQAFDGLTQACNGCHGAAGQGFIRIRRPEPGFFSSQDFSAQ